MKSNIFNLPIPAIVYVLSRWGECSLEDLREAYLEAGRDESLFLPAIGKLKQLGNLVEKDGMLVWIGPKYLF